MPATVDGFFGHTRPSHHNRPVITPAQREEIVRRYTEDGETAISIAADLGIRASLVRSVVPARVPGGTRKKRN